MVHPTSVQPWAVTLLMLKLPQQGRGGIDDQWEQSIGANWRITCRDNLISNIPHDMTLSGQLTSLVPARSRVCACVVMQYGIRKNPEAMTWQIKREWRDVGNFCNGKGHKKHKRSCSNIISEGLETNINHQPE